MSGPKALYKKAEETVKDYVYHASDEERKACMPGPCGSEDSVCV